MREIRWTKFKINSFKELPFSLCLIQNILAFSRKTNNFQKRFSLKVSCEQGTNARKVISEVYAFFVLQCTVFWRKSKHKTDVTA